MSASEVEKTEKKKSKGLKGLVKSKSKTESDFEKRSKDSKTNLSKTGSLKEVKEKKSESKTVAKSSSLKEIGEYKTASFSKEEKDSRGRLQRQLSISKQDSEMELKSSRQLLKEDSRDSGIVLEMNTKSKEKETVTRLNSQEETKEETKSSKKGSTISKIVKTVKSRTISSSSGEGTSASSDVKSSKSRSSSDKQAEGKKGSFIKRKETFQEESETVEKFDRDLDPVYSLLKCAADLPKVGKVTCMYCNGHHSASKPCSPVESGGSTSQVPSSPSSELHGIVEQSLGSEFRQFYKLTSPTNKTSTPFDHVI